MKIRIIFNPKKEWAAGLAHNVTAFLESNGHKVVETGAEATACIGGDGTILYAHYQKQIHGPVLGIGTMKSYICQLERNSWQEKILALLSGRIVPVMSLKASAGAVTYSALNDFVIHAKDYRVMGLRVTCNDEETIFRGDGIIVSSALGSAAYAYSAGGEQLAPLSRKMCVVPIAPYRREFQPLLLPPESTITIESDEPSAFIIDGILAAEFKAKKKVNIEKGDDIHFFEGVGFYK